MKSTIVLLILILLYTGLGAQNNWVSSINGLDNGFCINDFVVTVNNTLIAVGSSTNSQDKYQYHSVSYKSDDEGRSWAIIDSTNELSRMGVKCICRVGDTLLIYSSSVLSKSGDNGKSCSRINALNFDYDMINDFVTIKHNKVFAAYWYQQCCPTLNYPAVFVSTNTGTDWIMLMDSKGLEPFKWNDHYRYNAIGAVGDTLLLSISSNDSLYYIYRSIDEGAHWIRCSIDSTDCKITHFATTQSNCVYAMGSNSLYRSVDFGRNWALEKVDLPISGTFTLNNIGSIGNTVLLDVEDRNGVYTLYRTEDKSSVAAMEIKENMQVFPNPVSTILTIQTAEELLSVEIVSGDGKTIKRFAQDGGNVDVSFLSSGIYFVKGIARDRTYLKRIVKIR